MKKWYSVLSVFLYLGTFFASRSFALISECASGSLYSLATDFNMCSNVIPFTLIAKNAFFPMGATLSNDQK